jgi:non-specific serine/threonine protein kinase
LVDDLSAVSTVDHGRSIALRIEVPAEVTSYVGRERELAQARRLLAAGRLVTLVGPGGVGKTRLALHITSAVRDSFPDGATVVELAELRDARLLANTVADRLGLEDQSARAAVDTVVDHLRGRRMLLVLDNCEHLVQACAEFVGAVLAGCPEVVVLATSRQSLRVLGEQLLPVPPLSVPPAGGPRSAAEVGRYESLRLFVDRAGAVLPSFAVTDENCGDLARLCEGLEGLPLAIELAAVRSRSLSPRQMIDRLTDRLSLLTVGRRTAPQRQQTLRAMIDWSYELCSPAERLVWERCSVFSGTFDLPAAEHVCGGAGFEPSEVLDLIDSLLDKSVLLREEVDGAVRYRMLETLREYGQDRLIADNDHVRVRRLHRDWYAELTRRFAQEWLSRDQVAWVARLRRDHANLRVAMEFCASDPNEAVTGLLMATRIDDYWGIRGFHTEARIWLDRALAIAPPDAPERAAGLRMGGWFALLQGDIDAGVARLTEAGELAARLGDDVQAAYVAHAWGMAALFTGDVPQSITLFEGALAAFKARNELRGIMFGTFIYGYAVGMAGDAERAREILTANVEHSRKLGESFWMAWSLWALSNVDAEFDRTESADATARQALLHERELGNRLAEAFTTSVLAWVAIDQGKQTRAATLFGIADAIWTAIGASPDFYAVFKGPHDERVALTRKALGDNAYDVAYAEGLRLPGDRALHYALEESVGARPPAEIGRPLTKREFQIAGLVAEGLTNKAIATKLVIAQRTAETHVEHILTKLGVNNRAQIAVWVARNRG